MALTVNAKTYTADSFGLNAVGYVGPANTVTTKDTIRLSRVAQKPVSTSSGVARAGVNLTRTLTLTGAIEPSRDSSFSLNVTIPIGAAAADLDAISNDMGAWIATTAFKNLLKNALISQ
jgi:hypothetical protein